MDKQQSKFPPFPHPAAPIPALTSAEKGNWSKLEQHRRLWMETMFLPFWQGMGPVYSAILADNQTNADDGLTLTATIENWPESFEAQQQVLAQLMDASQLRQAWRSFAHWMTTEKSDPAEGQIDVRAALEKEHQVSARPLREIPLYSDRFRVACQQVICMPVRQWDAMFAQDVNYEPTSIDEAIVEKLATRIARVLNVPLQTHSNLDAARRMPVVWNTDPWHLLGGVDSHGMADRLFDEYLRPIEHDPEYIRTWRYDGFCGQLRVTGIGDEPWYVTVLAPDHFVGALEQLVRENEQ